MSTAPATVEADLNYLRNSGQRPVNYTYDPPPGVPRNSGEVDPRRVTIRNARLASPAGDLSLDRSGFQLVQHRSALDDANDYTSEARIRAVYYAEVESVLRTVTGAQKVLVFDHTLRDGTPGHGRTGVREPVRRVHDDQTFESAPRRVPRHLPKDEAELRLKRRFAIVNFWRPIGETVQRTPLAFCDARSIATQDLLPSDLVYPDWTGETYSFAWNPKHRWYYVPRQRTDEVTLLKIYDSQTDGTARLTAHTAFDDPTTAPDAPPRRSIEVRALVFW
jgi:hypothetical protein